MVRGWDRRINTAPITNDTRRAVISDYTNGSSCSTTSGSVDIIAIITNGGTRLVTSRAMSAP